MTKKATLAFFFLFASLTSCKINEGTAYIVLKNGKVSLVQHKNGGAFTKFQLNNNAVNPLEWVLPIQNQPEVNRNGFDFEGHFICLGTWGLPTENEQKAGIRLYGEPTAQIWKLDSLKSDPNQNQICHTSFKSKIEGLSLKREVTLYKNEPLVRVIESLTNDLPIGRPYNFLQHATFGGQFVSENLVIHTNAGMGFYQKGNFLRDSYENLEATAFSWPIGRLAQDSIDLRKTGEIPSTFLTSHVFDKNTQLGWAASSNKIEKILVGYVWDTKEYPWLNIWHQYKDGKVAGRALEFATCGAGLSFEKLMTGDYLFFKTPSFEFIDAKETITKTYYMFTLPISEEFEEVKDISVSSIGVEIKFLNSKGQVETIFLKK